MDTRYPTEFDPYAAEKKPRGTPWIALFIIGLLFVIVYASENPDSSISEFTKNLGSEIKTSSNIQTEISSSSGPIRLSVKKLALTSIDDNKWGNHEIIIDGIVEQLGIGSKEFYLYNEDLDYKVRIIGNVPPLRSESCGILSFPYYEVRGKLGIDATKRTYLISSETYSLKKCVSVR